MTTEQKNHAKNLILGALVADAAALGTHWIYDQEHIKKLAPKAPEFRRPQADDYAGVPGYFAHANKPIGAQSQYGEQVLVMLRSLVANNGDYNVNHFAQQFRTHFGYGGGYVGYIDNATRQSLDNMTLAERDAMDSAKSIAFDGEASVQAFVVKKALATRTQYTGDELEQKFAEAVRIAHHDDDVVAYGLKVLAHIQTTMPRYGTDDEQFPATAKLPALIARLCTSPSTNDDQFHEQIESAITVTSTHERALSYGHVCAAMMQAAITDNSVDGILNAAMATGNDSIQAALKSALSDPARSVTDVTKEFGMACDLKYGVPSIVHNLSTSASFTAAIRNNIYAGGDSCGRAIVIGALAGAVYGIGGEHGIPESWIGKLRARSETDALIAVLLTD